ncbi:MAG: hypothetical protein ACK2T3_05405 [Candidatus Promineifilaceae bacterium]
MGRKSIVGVGLVPTQGQPRGLPLREDGLGRYLAGEALKFACAPTKGYLLGDAVCSGGPQRWLVPISPTLQMINS